MFSLPKEASPVQANRIMTELLDKERGYWPGAGTIGGRVFHVPSAQKLRQGAVQGKVNLRTREVGEGARAFYIF
jgi:hypothetical protein